MSELVTGEAVALELRPARLPSRALAVLLDLIVAFAAYMIVTIVLVISTASLDEAAQIAISIATFLLVLVGAPIAVETLSHGRSLGKMAFGLRVVRDDGGPIRFRHALVRGAIGVVEILLTLGVIACIASLVSERGRRLGDVFAGTLVVRERIPAARARFVPPPPPWLAGRFSGLDLSAVPDGLWLAIRQYLTRMQQLDPQVGGAMAERLAADLAERTGAPVPQGIPPAAYLAAVVQERQAREIRRTHANGAGAGGPGHDGQYGRSTAPGAHTPVAAPPPAERFPTPAHPGYEAAQPGRRPEGPAQAPPPGPQQGGQSPDTDRPATGFVPPA
ncbi:membrane protein [Streptomyces spinoverrucosus]|uniref:Membrane protein n=1 Tax=Streptomyces spinoverrucosus TaxID=284043 RepID=A0A4Y3VTZ2_9ACTN|nr:RDD family protein [Streptomyces spinoverrucosus]GEC10113.1 membrane protein [Streptomyces spinoverrucosus]GHB80699.1 membrane protein [Streptomyces spinoverrucosus]